jgi:hypothetical protein
VGKGKNIRENMKNIEIFCLCMNIT